MPKKAIFLFSSVILALALNAHAAKPSDFGLEEGELISAADSNDPDVYIINENGYKRLFLNPTIFNFYGHLGGFSSIKKVTPETRDAFTTSSFYRNCETNDPKIYAMEVTSEDVGTLHWLDVSGSQVQTSDPNFFKKIFCINNNEANWYQKGSDFRSLGYVSEYSRSTDSFADEPIFDPRGDSRFMRFGVYNETADQNPSIQRLDLLGYINDQADDCYSLDESYFGDVATLINGEIVVDLGGSDLSQVCPSPALETSIEVPAGVYTLKFKYLGKTDFYTIEIGEDKLKLFPLTTTFTWADYLEIDYRESRDIKRIADVLQLRTAVELFFDDNGGVYPSALSSTNLGVYFARSTPPADPKTGAGYFYAYNPVINPTQYHIWTELEISNPAYLTSDHDINSTGWFGNSFNASLTLTETCSANYSAGSARDCVYDVGNY